VTFCPVQGRRTRAGFAGLVLAPGGREDIAEREQLPPDDWWVRQNLANELWHVDNTFMRPRATLSFLYGREVTPVGGNTEFCDMRLAWEALSVDEQAKIEGLTAHHWIMHSRTSYEDWPEPERRRHLLRLWLACEGGPALPASFTTVAQPATRSGRPAGIQVPGVPFSAPLDPC